ncbi:hypothetical protein Tco_0599013 [Tanacetum coccineum]
MYARWKDLEKKLKRNLDKLLASHEFKWMQDACMEIFVNEDDSSMKIDLDDGFLKYLETQYGKGDDYIKVVIYYKDGAEKRRDNSFDVLAKIAKALICAQDWLRSTPADMKDMPINGLPLEEMVKILEKLELDMFSNGKNTMTLLNIKFSHKKEAYDICNGDGAYLNISILMLKKIIQNGNSKKIISTGKDGVIRVLSPVSVAEIHAVEKERKARTILLMVIPKEHLRRFHGMDDAKEIWEAIRTRFGGNANSKKMQKVVLKQQFEAFSISQFRRFGKGYDRFQQLLSQLEAHGAEVSNEDSNHKFLKALPSAWSNLGMTMRTKPEINTLSIDDLYNNLRVFKQEIKGASKTFTSAQKSLLLFHKARSQHLTRLSLVLLDHPLKNMEILRHGGKGYCHIIRANQRDSVFVNFRAMLHNISRDDLVNLYKIVLQKTTAYGPEEDLESAFAKNLRIMFDPPKSEDTVWSLPYAHSYSEMGYYDSCNVHCLNLHNTTTIYCWLKGHIPYPKKCAE